MEMQKEQANPLELKSLAFPALNVTLCAGILIGNGFFNWMEDLGAALFFVLLAVVLVYKAKKGWSGSLSESVLPFACLAYLISRPLGKVTYWWTEPGTIIIMVSAVLMGVFTLANKKSETPPSRDRATYSFLHSVMIVSILASIACSFGWNLLSQNDVQFNLPWFSAPMVIMLLGASWVKHVTSAPLRLKKVLSYSATGAAVLLVMVGALRTSMVNAAFAEARDAKKNNRVEEARKLFVELAENNKRPDLKSKSRLELARLAMKEGNLEEAFEHVKRAENAEKNDLKKVRSELAGKFLELAFEAITDNASEAKRLSGRAYTMAPFDSKTLLDCGRLHEKLGSNNQAMSFYEKSIKLNRKDNEAWEFAMTLALKTNDFAKGASLLVENRSLKIENAYHKVMLGRELVLGGHFILCKALLIDMEKRGNLEGSYLFARACMETGSYMEAERTLEKLISEKGVMPDAYYLLGVCREKREKGLGKELFEKTLEILPEHFEAARALAELDNRFDGYQWNDKPLAPFAGRVRLAGWKLDNSGVRIGESTVMTLIFTCYAPGNSDDIDFGWMVDGRWVGRMIIEKQEITPAMLGGYFTKTCPVRIPFSSEEGSADLVIKAFSQDEEYATPPRRIAELSIGKRIIKDMGPDRVKEPEGNLVKNWSFEEPTGEDNWTFKPYIQGAQTSIITGEGVNGKRCLAVEFDGTTDVNYYHTSSKINVKGSSKYLLVYWIKSNIFVSKSLVKFEIIDGKKGYKSFCVSSSKLLVNDKWSRITLPFITNSDMKDIIIRIRRCGSDMSSFSNRYGLIHGSVLIDGVSLTKTN